MPALITLQKFLSGGDWKAIDRYKKTGILPSYVARPKPNKYSKGAAGMTALDRKLLKEKKERLKKKKSKGAGKKNTKSKYSKGAAGLPARKLGIPARKLKIKKPKTYTY